MLVNLVLLLRQFCKAEQLTMVLTQNPALVNQGYRLGRDPRHPLHLPLQGHQTHLGRGAQVMGHIGEEPVLQELAVHLPEHAHGGALGVLGGVHLHQVGTQGVGQGVHQAIGVLVKNAIGHRATAAQVLGQEAEPHLIGGKQAGGVHDHHKAHLLKKGGMARHVIRAAQLEEGHQSHVGLLLPGANPV